MAALIQEKVGIKDTSCSVTVPANPKAKLMYYLDCVATVTQLDNPNLRRLRDFRSYYSLSEEETDALLVLIVVLSPDELIGKVVFPSEDCGGGANQFIELTAATHMLAAVSPNVLIGGESKRVANIMFFQRRWMENNYISPVRSFESRLQRLSRGLPGRAPAPPKALPPPSRPRAHSPLRPPPSSSCCNIL